MHVKRPTKKDFKEDLVHFNLHGNNSMMMTKSPSKKEHMTHNEKNNGDNMVDDMTSPMSYFCTSSYIYT